MSNTENQKARFEMQIPKQWMQSVDEFRDGRGISRAEAIRRSTTLGMHIAPLLGDIVDLATIAIDDSNPDAAASAARLRSAIKKLL